MGIKSIENNNTIFYSLNSDAVLKVYASCGAYEKNETIKLKWTPF